MLKHIKQSDIYKYLVAAVLLAVSLYPKFPLFDVPGTFVSIRLEDFVLAAVAVIILSLERKRLLVLARNKMVQAILLFLTVGLISLFSAVFVTKTAGWQLGFLHWARRVEYFIPFFLGFLVVRRNKNITSFVLKILILVVFIAFIYGFGQKHFGFPVIVTQNEEYSQGVALKWIPGSHINSTFAGHYDLATFLIMVLPIFLVSTLLLDGTKTKLALLMAFFAGLWLLVNTASRISIVSYLIAASAALIIIKKYKYIPVMIVVSIAFIGFSTNLLARYGSIWEVMREKVVLELKNNSVLAAEGDVVKRRPFTPTPTPPPPLEDRSTSIRLNVEWPRAIRALSKNPLLGTGYSSITLATDNDYLRLLGEVGLIGFFAFLLILARIFNMFLKAWDYTKTFGDTKLAFMAGFAGSLSGLLLNAFFIDIFEASKFATQFWLLIGIATALIYEKKINKNY